jgi:outer membrane receptor protein involved in Fe transport
MTYPGIPKGKENKMKKALSIGSVLALALTLVGSGAWAQSSASSEGEEYVLEEIMVTAEKRTEDIQNIASSTVAIDGSSLMEMGKISTAQILENVPNVRATGDDATNITIRGVRAKPGMPGSGRTPSSTALYVDDVFSGAGGGYDIERIEVLLGPQGTLYGRSANGGVVSTHTNDPKLNEFNSYLTGEIGKAQLQNVQGAVNIPLGDKFAVRAAGHYFQQGHSYFYSGAGKTTTKEGRVKLLYQPLDALKILFIANSSDTRSQTGGATAKMPTPTTIDYLATIVPVTEGVWFHNRQGTLRVDYDFGKSSLTYIGSYRNRKQDPDPGFIMVMGTQTQSNKDGMPYERTHTEEIRWASDSEGKWTWLMGASYYSLKTEDRMDSTIISATIYPGGPPDDPNTSGAYSFGASNISAPTNMGFFTEETFALNDNLRVTAGLRYDKTRIYGHAENVFNLNMNENHNVCLPNELVNFGLDQTLHYSNFTYKLRFEYDLTPDNMLYALTSTGFLPGNTQISARIAAGPEGLDISFSGMPMEEEKLTSYEIGSKNQFFDDRLRVNGSLFYYDYEGYRNAVNVTTVGTSPTFVVISTPLTMIGAELSTDWIVTPKDRVSFNAGYLNAKITDYPNVPLFGDSRDWLYLDRIPNNPKLTYNMSYNHTFSLANGSFLEPSINLRWTGGQYLQNVTKKQVDDGLLAYAWQDSYMVGDIGATWVSPNGMYSASGYIRNFTDEEYKNGTSVSTSSLTDHTVTPGNPRVWGVSLTIKF